MSDAVSRLSGALLGRYRIARKLDEGGMATVYLARDERHDREAAVKVLRPELAAVVGAERFLAEIRTTAKLQHPHILPLHDSGEAEGFLFYVMPYVEGESLRDRLDREHQLPVDDAVRIATAVAEGLDYAHRHGVIHRDIKPANILLVDGKPVISDFGIALAVGNAGAGRLTETGLSLGTPHYMSPEQATGDQQVGTSTDIYALGCVLYEMLVGEPPYTGSTPQAVLGKIITREPEPITERRKSVPSNVDATVARALEKVPADRFASAGAFAAALADPAFRHWARAVAASAAPELTRWKRVSAVTGALAALVAEEVRAGTNGQAFFAATDDVLVYRRGGVSGVGYGRPYWVDRSGSREPLPLEPGLYETPRFSPDGTKVAMARLEDDENVWVFDGASGQATQVTFEAADESAPVWSPDGEWVAYASASGTDNLGIYRVRADGSGEPERLSAGAARQVPTAVTPDGRTLTFTEGQVSDGDVRTLSLELRETAPLIHGDFEGGFASLSPNGRFLAYQSAQPGYVEVFVAAFPTLAGRRLVSTLDIGMTINFTNADAREARLPLWSRDGRELFWRSGPAIVRVPMNPADGTPTGAPEVLFRGGIQPGQLTHEYDISPDGRRFVIIGGGSTVEAPDNEFVVVQNWLEEVRARLES